jgi:hypothetical protein
VQTRAFEQEREDHIFDLTIGLVRSGATWLVHRILQVDGSRNKEDTGGCSILEVDDGTEDLNANQPQDHCNVGSWLV